jgi:hypothetical protein
MDKNNLVEDMGFNGDHGLSFYDGCMYGKHHHTQFPLSGDSCAKEFFGLVHTNLCGPMATFHGRAKYFLTFIDDFSRKAFFNIMKTKFGMMTNLRFSKLW